MLRTVLEDAAEEPDPGRPTAKAALHELGVYRLAPCDVLLLLGIRVARPGQ